MADPAFDLLTPEDYERLCFDFGKETVDPYVELIGAQINRTRKAQNNRTIRLWIKKDAARRRHITGLKKKKDGPSGASAQSG